MKYDENGDFQKTCNKALKQIEPCDYTEALRKKGIKYIYAVAYYKKNCQILKL